MMTTALILGMFQIAFKACDLHEHNERLYYPSSYVKQGHLLMKSVFASTGNQRVRIIR